MSRENINVYPRPESPVEQENQIMPLQIDVALKMIPEFHGSRDELHKFIACCDIVSVSCTTRADRELLLNVIKTKLSGNAYNLVKYKTFASWDELKIILQEQYLEKRTIAQIQTELLTSKQQQGESIRSFANRLERLTLDLTDACIANQGIEAAPIISSLNSNAVLKAFVEGLNGHIKLIIKASRFTKFEDAVEAAVEEERTQKSSRLQNFPNTNSSNQNQKNRQKCFKCGKPNHIAANCYSNSNSFPKYPKTEIKREANVHNLTIICRYCKNPGHTIEECRKRQYNNSRNRREHSDDNARSTNSMFVHQRTTSSQQNKQPSQVSGNGSGRVTTSSATQVRDIKSA